ncbi:hypothetical protein BH23ACT9_BH23ACT9_40000 [soil metagenome]
MTLVIAGALYVAGSNIWSGWVVILTAAMVGATVLDVLAVWRTSRRTRVEAVLTGPATTTQPAVLRLTVARPDHATSLQLSDEAGLRVVIRGGHATVTATAPLPRGHHTAVQLSARTSGPLGLAVSTRSITAPTDLWSRPGTLAADGRVRALVAAAGDDRARRPVTGQDDVRGIREFTPSDPRRAVHWRATARQGRLMVREMDGDAGAQLFVAIDAGAWTSAGLDLACEATASIATAAAAVGHDVRVAVDGALHTWDDQTTQVLAGLSPAAGVPDRPLQPVPAAATVRFAPSPQGALIADDVVLADRQEVVAWLRADG